VARLRGAVLPAGLAVAAMAVVLAAGCGLARPRSARPAQVPPGAPVAVTAATAAPRVGGRLRLPGSDPSTLDPALVRDVASAEYLYELYNGLVTLSSDLRVVPDLATGWQTDATGTVYTFTLRTDALFQDGRPVTAEDVVYSLTRACSPEAASPVAATYLGDIVGCLDYQAGRAAGVAGLAAPDPGTVAVRIDAPKRYFLAKLTYPTAFVVDRKQVAAGGDWTRHPNGTGPFRLASYEPERRLVLGRNERFYGGAPFLDAVEFDLSASDVLARYENGELDAVPVGGADLARVSDPLNPLARELLRGPGSLDVSYIGFNTRVAPFDDVHVRRAFNFALDKTRLARVVLQGAVEAADWILPPGLPGHSADVSPFRFDPAEARRELAASRYGSGGNLPPVTLNSPGEGGTNPALAAVADYLGETLGARVALEETPWDTFQRELEAGRYGLVALGWSADYPDPQDFLDVLFHSASPLNHTGYANPEVDRLLEAARTEPDEAARLALYRQAERKVLGDAPWLPLYHGVEHWLVAPNVRGFSIPPIVLPRLARVWLAE
jgi:oligopeptide transport system substrate-binding protein